MNNKSFEPQTEEKLNKLGEFLKKKRARLVYREDTNLFEVISFEHQNFNIFLLASDSTMTGLIDKIC